MQSSEEVVLVNERNEVLGTAPKATVHGADTPLHRGFSVFLFNAAGDVLIQQRSHLKKTWPLVWAGSCCGHPGPGESVPDAICRRAQVELGLEVFDLQEKLPDFRYRCERDGIWENELCPVWFGRVSEDPKANPAEVEDWAWIGWDDLVEEATNNPGGYAEWMVLEVLAL